MRTKRSSGSSPGWRDADVGRTRPRIDPSGREESAQPPRLLLGPLFWGAFRARANDQRQWCYPSGPSEVRVAGPDTVRVLLVGDGPAAGCGVLTHELGVAGQLARRVAQDLSRGVTVTVDAQPAASAGSTLRHLRGMELDGYDSIILMLAATDAFSLTSERTWRRNMAGLVDVLRSSDVTTALVTSAAPLDLAVRLSPFARRLTGDHARLLNQVTQEICARSATPMIQLDDAADLTPATYAMWGRRIGSHVVSSLLR